MKFNLIDSYGRVNNGVSSGQCADLLPGDPWVPSACWGYRVFRDTWADGQEAERPYGLAFGGSGVLYGTSGFVSRTTEIITIDTGTGSGTVLTPIDETRAMTDLAFSPLDGTAYTVDTINNMMLTINVSTGELTEIGANGIGVDYLVGLAFGPVLAPATAMPGICAAVVLLRRRRGLTRNDFT